MCFFRVRYIERLRDREICELEVMRCHTGGSHVVYQIIYVYLIWVKIGISLGPTQENHDCFESDLLQKYRDDQKTEAPKGINFSRYDIQIHKKSRTHLCFFCQPTRQVTSTLGIETPHAVPSTVRPRWNRSSLTHVSSLKPISKMPTSHNRLENHNHIPPNTASWFFVPVGQKSLDSPCSSMQSTPAGPVPEK